MCVTKKKKKKIDRKSGGQNVGRGMLGKLDEDMGHKYGISLYTYVKFSKNKNKGKVKCCLPSLLTTHSGAWFAPLRLETSA